ncbi:MAG: hypothetical protein AB7I35_21655 [Ramlibacter sp.]
MPEDTNETLAVQGLSTATADEIVSARIRGAEPAEHGWRVRWGTRRQRLYRVPCLDAKDAAGRTRRARLVITVDVSGADVELTCLMGRFKGSWQSNGDCDAAGALSSALLVARGAMRPRCAQRAAEAWALAEALGAPELMVKPYRPGGA